MIVNETVAAPIDWLRLTGKTLEGGYELGDVLESKTAAAHFRTRVLGDSSLSAYASFYVADGAVANEQLRIWQDLRVVKHPNLKVPLSSGRMKIDGVSTIYVVCSMPDETLSEILGDRGLTTEEGRELLKSLGQALLYLHSHGLAHGALSPEMAVAVGESIQISTECVRRINSVPKIEVANPRYLAPETKTANISMAADIWCLGATIFESLVQKKYEAAWFGDLEKMELGPTLQRCLDTNPHSRARLSDIIETPPEAGHPDSARVPASGRTKPVKVTRKPVETKRVRALDPSEMQLVKFDANVGLERLRSRVKSSGSQTWKLIVAGVAAVILLVVVIWLVILPKIESVGQPLAEQSQQQAPKSAWPTKTLEAPAAAPVPATPAPVAVPPTPTPEPAPVEDAKSKQLPPGTWRLVLGAYAHEADAKRRIASLGKTHPDLEVQEFTRSKSGPYYVVAGPPTSYAAASDLRTQAVSSGISRASYVGDLTK